MQRLLITAGAAAAWLLMGHLGLLAVLIYVWASAMATTANTAKTRATEQRVNNLVSGQTSTNQAIRQLQQGTFISVSGGSTIQLDTQQGSVTLHCGALSSFTSGPQTTFLAGLQKLNHLGGQPADNNTGSSWANGERGYINNCVQWINDLDGDLQNKGYMN